MQQEITKLNKEIDLKQILLYALNKKILISSITMIGATISVLFSLSLPNIYTSKALLAPVSEDETLSGKLSSFNSVSSLGGLSFSSPIVSKRNEGIERIKSYEFFSNYFLPNIKLENIMAVDKWIPEENLLIYDKNIFDKNNEKWVRSVKFPKQIKPSDQEAYEVYRQILKIDVNQRTSFIELSIDHHSPEISKKWLETIIYQINESMRKIDTEIAKKSISYLNDSSQATNIESIRDVIATLLENQMQVLMLAASTSDYVYKIIDSPIAPEYKSKPNRKLISILGTFLCFILSLVFVIILYIRSLNKMKY